MHIPETGHAPETSTSDLPVVTVRPTDRRRLARDLASAAAIHVAAPPRGTLGRGLARALATLPQLGGQRISPQTVAKRLRALESQLHASGHQLLAASLERVDAPAVHAVVVAVAPTGVERRDLAIDL